MKNQESLMFDKPIKKKILDQSIKTHKYLAKKPESKRFETKKSHVRSTYLREICWTERVVRPRKLKWGWESCESLSEAEGSKASPSVVERKSVENVSSRRKKEPLVIINVV